MYHAGIAGSSAGRYTEYRMYNKSGPEAVAWLITTGLLVMGGVVLVTLIILIVAYRIEKKHLFSMRSAIAEGWRGMAKNFWFFAGLIILTGVISAAPSVWQIPFRRPGGWITAAWLGGGFITQLLSWIISLLLSVAFLKIAFSVLDGKRPTYRLLLSGVSDGKLFLNYLLGTILYGVVTFFGTVLFIVPGIIWGIKYQFIPYFIIDRGMDPAAAFGASAEATAGAKLDLLLFGLLLGLINFAGLVALVFGLFATVPVVMLAHAGVYRALARRVK